MKPSLKRLAPLAVAATLSTLLAARADAQRDLQTAASPQPVLLVIANRDFSLEEYQGLRAALEAEGLEVRVAAGSLDPCIPWGGSLEDAVQPDVALPFAYPTSFSGGVFVGGWGASSYQYAFEGTYANPAYRRDRLVAEAANRVIGELLAQGKPVGALGHGVTVLAWARVNGVSPLRRRTVAAWAGGGPAFSLGGKQYADATVATRWHVEKNGGAMPLSSAIGDPTTPIDDVWVEGRIITGENYDSVAVFAKTFRGGVYVAAGDL